MIDQKKIMFIMFPGSGVPKKNGICIMKKVQVK